MTQADPDQEVEQVVADAMAIAFILIMLVAGIAGPAPTVVPGLTESQCYAAVRELAVRTDVVATCVGPDGQHYNSAEARQQ